MPQIAALVFPCCSQGPVEKKEVACHAASAALVAVALASGAGFATYFLTTAGILWSGVAGGGGLLTGGTITYIATRCLKGKEIKPPVLPLLPSLPVRKESSGLTSIDAIDGFSQDEVGGSFFTVAAKMLNRIQSKPVNSALLKEKCHQYILSHQKRVIEVHKDEGACVIAWLKGGEKEPEPETFAVYGTVLAEFYSLYICLKEPSKETKHVWCISDAMDLDAVTMVMKREDGRFFPVWERS